MPRDPVPTAKEINEAHRAAWASAKVTVQHAIKCGQLLIAKKADLGHGEFQIWVAKNCDFEYSTAARYMKASQANLDDISSIRGIFPSGQKPQTRKRIPEKKQFKSLPGRDFAPQQRPNSTLTAREAPGIGNPAPQGQLSAVRKGSKVAPPMEVLPPDPDAPERPDDVDEDAAFALAEKDQQERFQKIMDSDEKLAAALEQIKQQSALLATVMSTRDNYMAGKAEVTKWLKAEQRKCERLERENKKLIEQIDAYKERIAIMEAA